MSIEVKPGRWQQRDGNTATVRECRPQKSPYVWQGVDGDGDEASWRHDGRYLEWWMQNRLDLMHYLGPEQQVGGRS